jgi:hypothetical protein
VKVLTEAATAIKASGGRWRAILAVPGQGSSGKYSAEMLQRFGPSAFPPGMKAYINHDENRDPRDLLGTYPEGAFWDAEHGSEGALVSELLPLPRYSDFVAEVAPHVGLSIFALGKSDEEGNITELLYDRMNGVDMVGYGGLEGSGLAEKLSEKANTLLEIARATTPVVAREKDSMTPEELKAILAEALAPVISFVSEQKLAAEAARLAALPAAESTEPTIGEAVEAYAAASVTVRDAQLFPLQEAALLASLAKGEDITAALETAKAIKSEATATVGASAPVGGRRSEAAGDTADYSLGLGWKL